jgi:hypothetical protein
MVFFKWFFVVKKQIPWRCCSKSPGCYDLASFFWGIVCQTWLANEDLFWATQHPKFSGHQWCGVHVQGIGSICSMTIGREHRTSRNSRSRFDFLKTGIETYFYSASSYTGIFKSTRERLVIRWSYRRPWVMTKNVRGNLTYLDFQPFELRSWIDWSSQIIVNAIDTTWHNHTVHHRYFMLFCPKL